MAETRTTAKSQNFLSTKNFKLILHIRMLHINNIIILLYHIYVIIKCATNDKTMTTHVDKKGERRCPLFYKLIITKASQRSSRYTHKR